MKKKNIFKFSVNKQSVIDKGNGKVMFSTPVVITNDKEQWNGTKYDIDSLDTSQYRKRLTADHEDSITSVIGNVIGLKKSKHEVTIDGIDFAVDHSALAKFSRDMLVNGYLGDFSTETIGSWPDDDGVFKNSSLVGLSMVVVGNNKQAHVNEIAMNCIKQSEQEGLDTDDIVKFLKYPLDKETETDQISINNNKKEVPMKFVTVKNDNKFSVEIEYKNAAGETVKTVLTAGQTVDVSEDQKEAIESLIKNAVAPTEAKTEAKADNALTQTIEALTGKITDLEQKIFDNKAKEPEFKSAAKNSNSDVATMGYKERHGQQIIAAWDMLKKHDNAAGKRLIEINKINLEALQKAGKVSNSMTIGDFGNFVISPELLGDIEGVRSDYRPLIERFPFRETLSLQMAWLTRNGDVNMQEVEMCDDGASGNLKPISEYEAEINTSNLHELAAVTPVCNAATRFLAVDLLEDVAAGYRTDFDRKRAQLIIARLQQAVNETGNSVAYNLASGAMNPLISIISVASRIAENITNGVWVFNTSSYFELLTRRLAASSSQDPGFDLFTTGNMPQFLGSPYVVVPNDLMPSLNSAGTKSFTVEGQNVTITNGLFYADPSTWSGRTSGGLQYDLSTEAAYEVSSTVKSAFQRNELVLRGSFFRGGAIRDVDKVAGLVAAAIS